MASQAEIQNMSRRLNDRLKVIVKGCRIAVEKQSSKIFEIKIYDEQTNSLTKEFLHWLNEDSIFISKVELEEILFDEVKHALGYNHSSNLNHGKLQVTLDDLPEEVKTALKNQQPGWLKQYLVPAIVTGLLTLIGLSFPYWLELKETQLCKEKIIPLIQKIEILKKYASKKAKFELNEIEKIQKFSKH